MNIASSPPTVTVSGIAELTAANAPSVRDSVRAALKPGHTALVLDLSAMKFIDSSGLGALISLQKSLTASGGSLRILNPSPVVSQIIELTRLHRVLEIVHSA